MKKLFLLLSIGSIGLAAHAQENHSSVLFAPSQTEEAGQRLQLSQQRTREIINYSRGQATQHVAHKSANKATSVTSRWYNYGDYLDTFYQDNSAAASISGVIIWNDTLGEAVYTSGLAHNKQSSVGNVFMPQAAGFNDANYYTGEMMIDATNAYTIDSIRIYGNHNINPAKTSVIDTVIISTLHGADLYQVYYTGMNSRYAYDTVRCADIDYDSVVNTGASSVAPAVVTTKVPITASMWGDTLGDGTFVLKLPVSISAAANEKCAVTISFKTGDPAFPTTLPGDTIDAFTGVFKYNSFYPLSLFKVIGTNVGFATYFPGDYNEGIYKTLPNMGGYHDSYIPQWAFYQGAPTAPTASYLQDIYVDWHAKCTNCLAIGVGDVHKAVIPCRAYPNPADNNVNISFTLSNATSAKVTLMNALGQVVATQEATDKASFNTTVLPAGVYVYSIVAGEERATGRITVSH